MLAEQKALQAKVDAFDPSKHGYAELTRCAICMLQHWYAMYEMINPLEAEELT